ncbi:Gfo/Idh/MocA family protein [Micromonospora endolithica]|uniref:Gfo/Idh/MocA family oxidoreductase n=1 Tax=Micromonospora endolithica TaxID=230091 RepID=A0A3A9ZPU7_9ACTN|nr:gfo/Idh/MocA family oxidoreductase [Micromonospora endolithica]
MTPVRLGIMGCASIARRRILPAASALDEVDVVAVASRDLAKADLFAARFGGRAVQGYARMLEMPDVDAVYIALPAALHAPWVEAALEAGKHVLAEKPLTTEVDRTEELMALAFGKRLVLTENVMFIHHHQHVVVRRLIRDGAIGEVREMRAAFTIPELPPDDIRYRADLGGGALLDIGLYPVRAAVHHLGGRLEVAEATLTSHDRFPVEDGGSAVLHGPRGVRAVLTFGMRHAYASRYEVIGDRGRVVVDRAFTPPADFHPVLRLERHGRGHRGGVEEIRLPAEDQVALALRSFATAVRRGAAPDEDTLRQARLLEAIRTKAGPAEPRASGS